MDILQQMADAVAGGQRQQVMDLAAAAIAQQMDPVEVIEKGFNKGMQIIGDKFGKLECFLPELIASASAMIAGVELLEPKIRERGGREKRGKVLTATIYGDMHDIGKNIVKLMLQTSGFEVVDLGKNVPVPQIIQTVERERPDIVAMSALMTTTMIHIPTVIRILKERGLRNRTKVMVGGAPVLPGWAEEIGADGYGLNAGQAVDVAKRLMAMVPAA